MSITQRFFLTNSAAGFTPTTLRGAWDQTASAVTKSLGRLPSGATATVGIAEVNATNNWDVLLYRGVSDPFDKAYTFTTSDLVQWCAGVKESSLSANDFFHIHIFVLQGSTDTLRGTILTDSIGATEWPTTATAQSEGTKALTSLACSAGDRLVIEIGYRAVNTVTTSFTGTLNYGGVIASIVAAQTSVTTNPGWVEFTLSDNLFNVSSQALNPSDKWSSIVLSSGNLIASFTNATGAEAGGSVRATLGRNVATDTGVYVFAVKIKKWSGTETSPLIGLSMAGMPVTGVCGFVTSDGSSSTDASNVAFLGSQTIWLSGGQLGGATTPPAYAEGDTVFVIMDVAHRVFYQRVNGGNWFGFASSSANPDTDAPGLGGANAQSYDWASLIRSGVWYPTIGIDDDNGQTIVAEFDASAWGHGLSVVKTRDTVSGPTYSLSLAQGSYALTGEPVNLLYGRKLSLAQGSYALTGKPVGILRGFKISLAQGAYALTGNAVSLLYGRKLSLAQGAISVAGQSVGLRFNRKLSLAQGSYSVTGNAVGLFRGFKLALAQGVYNLTGQAVGLLYNRKFSLGQGSYAINGQPLSLLRSYLLSLGQGAYTLSGQSVNLLRGYVLTLGRGSYTLAGQAMSFVYSGAGAATYTFALSCGSYALSGQALSVRYGRRLLLASGAYNLSGQPVSLLRGFRLALASGAYSIAGQAVAFKRSYVMQLAAGLYAVAGQAINLVHATAGVFGYTPRFAFKAEQRNRTFKAEARDRTFTAAPNNRTFKAEARSRTFKADARQRTNED